MLPSHELRTNRAPLCQGLRPRADGRGAVSRTPRGTRWYPAARVVGRA